MTSNEELGIDARVELRPGSASYGREPWSGPGTVTKENLEGYLIVEFDGSGLSGGFRPSELISINEEQGGTSEEDSNSTGNWGRGGWPFGGGGTAR